MTKTKTILLVFSFFSLAVLSGSFWSFFQRDIVPAGLRLSSAGDSGISPKETSSRTPFMKGESSGAPVNLATTPLLDLQWEEVARQDGRLAYKNGDFFIAPEKLLRLDSDTVGTREIRRHAIEASDIDTNSITSRTIRDGTIRGRDIDEDTTIEVASLIVSGLSTFSGGLTTAGDVDMAGNIITNIGASGTDFTASGGLTLAGAFDLNDFFHISATGDLAEINDVAYGWPSVQGGVNTVLRNDGNGTLSWVSVGAASISPDSLDFTEFKDALTLDASTDISITGTNFLSLTNTGTGNSFVVNDAASDTTPFVIDAAGNVGIGDTTPASLLTVGTGDLFQVNSSGAIASATGITSSGTITFSGLATGVIISTSGVLSSAAELAVARGGTGASDATAARTNLGLTIGTDVQAYDATLLSIAALGTAADKIAYTTGIDTWAEAALTDAGRALIDDLDAAAQRTTLGLGTLATQSGTFSGSSSGTNTGDQNNHSLLDNLAADDHTQYVLLAGRAGGQTLIGGTAASNTLTLQSTSNATKGKLLFGTSAYDEVNNRLGIGTAVPAQLLDLMGHLRFSGLTPPTALTATLGSGVGNVDNEVKSYYVSFVNARGESSFGTQSNLVTVVDNTVNGKIELTNIPLGPTGTTQRKIYRTKPASGNYYSFFLATLNDNTTTTYTDNIANASLPTQQYVASFSNDTTTGKVFSDSIQSLYAGKSSVSFGRRANSVLNGDINTTAIGTDALANNLSINSTAVGVSAGKSITTSGGIVAVGVNALTTGTTGVGESTAVGYNALRLSTASLNTAVGGYALNNLSTGGQNTAIGHYAGNFIADGVTANQTGSQSVFLGHKSYPLANGDTNEIVLGYLAIGNGSNTATIGNASLLRTYLTGVNLKAGTATANTAPLKFTSGALNTTAEAGSVEFLTDKFYGTITTGAARHTFATLESSAQTFSNDISVPDEVYGVAWNASLEVPTKNALYDKLELFAAGTGIDHGGLTGLADDDHTQYALLAGRAGGQTLIGGTALSENLTLQSTSNATKGKILFGTSAYDEVNNRLGVGDTTPASLLSVGNGDLFQVNSSGDVFSTFSLLNGSSTASGAGTASTTLVLAAGGGTNFDVGNYVLVNGTYAKITAKATDTLTISPALTWTSTQAVTEYHIPEIGATNTASTLVNRYGRGYFIDGMVTGNGSTYYTDASILQTTGTTFSLLNTGTTTLNIGGAATALSLGAGTGVTTVNNDLSLAQDLWGANTTIASGTLADATLSGTCVATANTATTATFVSATPITSSHIFYNSTRARHSRVTSVTTCVDAGSSTHQIVVLADSITGNATGDSFTLYNPTSNLGNTAGGFFNSLYAINLTGLTSTLTGGFDVAEQYETEDASLEPGDIVATDPKRAENIMKAGRGGRVIGAVSSNPALTLGNEQIGIWKKVALTGRIPIKVTLENGPIRSGDPITLSSTPGRGMKAASAGNVIGYALADFDEETQENGGKVMVFINLDYYGGDTDLAGVSLDSLDMRVAGTETGLLSLGAQLLAAQAGIDESALRLTNLETMTDQLQLDMNTQASRTALLETQMQTLTEQLSTLTDFYATFDLGNLVAKDVLGNVDLLDGKLRAKILETGALVIENAEVDAPTIGRGKIKIGETKVIIETKGVRSASHIIVTPRDLTAEPLAATEVIDAESFIVEIPHSATQDISFDWWVVEEK